MCLAVFAGTRQVHGSTALALVAADRTAVHLKIAIAQKQHCRRRDVAVGRVRRIILDCTAVHLKMCAIGHTNRRIELTADLVICDCTRFQRKNGICAVVLHDTDIRIFQCGALYHNIRAIHDEAAAIQNNAPRVVPSVQFDLSLKLQRSTVLDHKQIFRFMAAVAKDDLLGVRRDDHRFALRNRDRILQLDILFNLDRLPAPGSGVYSILQGHPALFDRITGTRHRWECIRDVGHPRREGSGHGHVVPAVVDGNRFQTGTTIKCAGRDIGQVGADLYFLDSSAFLERIVTQCFQAVRQLHGSGQGRIVECPRPDGFQRFRQVDALDIRPDKGPCSDGLQGRAGLDRFDVWIV